MSKKYFYITTPIYYPSAKLHIGHAYCTTIADTIARYKRLQGIETFFLTGTDEHGEKIQKNAEAAGKTPQAFVDEIVAGIKDLWKVMKVSNDKYIRTTDDYHMEVVQKVFTKMLEQDDIYLGEYEGWYCTPCESFWTDTQAGEEHICPDCGRPVHKAKEESYFFRMSKYSKRLLDFYESHPDFITPESRKNEMVNNFIKPGLEDLCVSRTSFDWGIPVRENPRHVVYVWLDALFNYASALGYLQEDDELYNKFWSDDAEILHLVGNDITRFHVIYWPIFLMSMGMRCPDKVYVHGLIMMKDGKMSKSKGNVISPNVLIDRYGLDALRYYYVSEVVFGTDGQFTPEQFVERVNIDLANDFGNLLNRTVGMITKYFGGIIPEYQGCLNDLDKDMEAVGRHSIEEYHHKMDALKVNEAFAAVFNYISRANKYIEESKPWELAKDPERNNELKSVMNHLANTLRQAAILLSPALLEAPEKLFNALGISEELRKYSTLRDFDKLGGETVTKGNPLFPRLDATVEVEYIKNLMQGK
ncbi:MAG: methionine--tRNA ligase [Erysipelotrichaceae bacterium]|nr:methionine--tRNA ligase [Erysipelotrichaceae bacterium]